MKAIFECMNNLGKFNGEGEFGLDEQIKILNYVFIKAKPQHIFANCQYMELFIGNKNDAIEGQNLAELKVICEHVANLSSSELNVKEEEFKENCSKEKNRSESNSDLESVI